MKTMLFLSSELPYPPHSGGRIKSFRLVDYLAKHYQLSVSCILKGNDSDYKDEFLQKFTGEFYAEHVNVERNAKNLMISYYKNVPLNWYRTYSKTFAQTIAQQANQFDIIFVDHYEVFQYIPESFAGLIILHEHNAEYVMWERFAKEIKHPAKRLAALLESYRIKKYELKSCNHSDIIFAAPNDIDNLIKIGVNPDKCKLTYHLGDDSQLDLPDLVFENTEKALINVGTLSWEANVDGLLWFLDEAWPLIKQDHADIKFYIVGKNPDKRLLDISKNDPNIIFTGFVENLETYFSKCRVFVAPVRFGSGIKVKVINAMSRGLPVVTTRVGTEGLDVQHMKHIALSETPEDMRNNVNQLLTDKSTWQTIEQNSRILIKDKYTWDKVLNAMKVEMDKAMEKKYESKSVHTRS